MIVKFIFGLIIGLILGYIISEGIIAIIKKLFGR
jgi:hypothetical protein